MIGVIPAAGKGTRLGKLGKETPKSLIEIRGKTLLERTINHLKIAGVKKIIIVVGYKKEDIIDFLNSKDFAINIQIVVQEKQKGLADAIFQTEKFVNEPFIVHLPDNLFSEYYKFCVKEFLKNNPDLIMLYKKMSHKIPKFSFVIENNIIKEVLCGKRRERGYEGVGLYIFRPTFFDYCRKALKNLKEGKELNDTNVIIEYINDKRKVMALEYKGKNINITTENDILRENSENSILDYNIENE